MFNRLESIEQGPLSHYFNEITMSDDLYPLLSGDHSAALDRRLDIVLQIIGMCAEMKGWRSVLVAD